MARRSAKNTTNISRLVVKGAHDAWVGFLCVKCGGLNTIHLGGTILAGDAAYESCVWKCAHCRFLHGKDRPLPGWKNWPTEARAEKSVPANRFWQGFFRIHTENPAAYWKQCNVCGRVLPFSAFSHHKGWGPLEKQMECRACKGAINAVLNPLRTKEQLHESAVRRRVSELLLKGENQRLSHQEIFERFGGKCFKTGVPLDINARDTWQIDHILPSVYLYPLTSENACLLSKDANQNKKAIWPSKFYTGPQLNNLARITGASIELLSSPDPVVNANIDVNACVSRYLNVRHNTRLDKRVAELKQIIVELGLFPRLSAANRKLLGLP